MPYFWGDKRLLDLGLSTGAIAAYCVLASCENERNQCWPSHEYIAARIGTSKRTSIRAVKELVKAGVIIRVRVYDRYSGCHRKGFELMDLVARVPRGDLVSPLGDKCSTSEVPNTVSRKCQKRTPNEDSLNKELGSEAAGQTRTDPLLDLFTDGFEERYGHRPTNDRSRQGWEDLRSEIHPEILRAKIEAWWDFPLPRAFHGNHTLGAFLACFDDVPIDPLPAAQIDAVRLAEDWLTEMKTGTPAGKGRFRDLVRGITDPEAKRATLKRYGGIHNDDDIEGVIAACDDAR